MTKKELQEYALRFTQGDEVMYRGKPVKVLGMNCRTREMILLVEGDHKMVPIAELELIDGFGVETR